MKILVAMLVVPAASIYQPGEICLLTDHEPIERGRCGHLASAVREVGARLRKDSRLPNEQYFERALNYFSGNKFPTRHLGLREHLENYNQVIPCLNRAYACEHGYNFLMPSTPRLAVIQPQLLEDLKKRTSTNRVTQSYPAAANGGLSSGGSPPESKLEHVHAELDAMAKICPGHNVSLTKAWAMDPLHETRRSQTWCKILLLEAMLSRFQGCKVAVFVDADLLIVPTRAVGAPPQSTEAWAHALSGLSHTQLKGLVALGVDRDMGKFEKLVARLEVEASLGAWDSATSSADEIRAQGLSTGGGKETSESETVLADLRDAVAFRAVISVHAQALHDIVKLVRGRQGSILACSRDGGCQKPLHEQVTPR